MFNKLKRAALGAKVPHAKTTADQATVVMPLPSKILLPMQQHIGTPCEPVVKKGDAVQVGTLVGQAQGTVSANIYSSVSGTVTGVESYTTAAGTAVMAVAIEPDGQQTVDPSVKAPKVTNRQELLEAVRNSGLVGLGGAGFPTAVKLDSKKTLHTLLVNAAECEPYLTSDTREMLEHGDTIQKGIQAVMKHLGISKCIMGIESNKPQCIKAMEQMAADVPGMSVKVLPARYPQGAEKVLVEKLTGAEVPQGGLPADVGVVVMNVTTLSVLGSYLETGMPLVKKRVTVDGDAVASPKNVEVPIGTPASQVLEFCGLKEPVAKLISGGPMMGVSMPSLESPVIKQTNGLLALSQSAAQKPAMGPCIRCGRCIDACPMGLAPVQIAGAFNKKDDAALKQLCVDLCMLCGSCSYVCPAKRPVTQTMSLAKRFAQKEEQK